MQRTNPVALRSGTAARAVPAGLAAPSLAVLLLALSVLPAASAEDAEAAIRERDARIEALERRIEALERRIGGGAGAGAGSPSVPPPPLDRTADGPPPEPGRPGFDVDPEAAERALERTLSDVGSLLLASGRIDVAPFLTYEYSEDDANRVLTTIPLADGDDLVLDTVRRRRDELTTGVDLRVGLPYDAQIEARVPFVAARARSDQNLQSARDDTGFGFGNPSIGVAKTIVREDGWIPDVIGRLTYDSTTGPDESGGVVIDDDFHEITASVSLLKRQDPLAFTAGFSYNRAFERDDLRPGDVFGASVGTFLAVSPETSLRLGFAASFRDELTIGGMQRAGSEERVATATFGASSVLASNVLLNGTLGIGLTEDAPDFFFGVTLPVRFGFR